MIWLALLFILSLASSVEALPVTRYATSTARGGDNVSSACLTTGTRCTVARALLLTLNAGDTISLEGNTMASPYEYKGANDMIVPAAGRSGTDDNNRISVICEVDGGCRINAEFASGRSPLRLNGGNSWWLFQGMNLHNSLNPVIYLTGSGGNNNNKFIKVVAWDAAIDANRHVISLSQSSNNLFEDVAAFGTGRKIFEVFDNSNNNTCRRCWFRAEGSTIGPGPAATPWYKSTGTLFENVLVTWSMESLPYTYTAPNTGITYNAYTTPGGMMLSPDRIESATTPKLASATIRGTISYNKASDKLNAATAGGVPGGPIPGIAIFGASSITMTDILRVMDPAHSLFNQRMGIVLTRRPLNCTLGGPDPCEAAVTGNTADRLTSIRGSGKCYGANCGDSFGTNTVSGFTNETDWTVTHTSVGTSLAAVQDPWQNTSVNGARLCYQWGTTVPLWPWPMNDRIIQATTQAGAYTGPCTTNCKNQNGTAFTFPARAITDVTADIESLLGTIPSTCKTGTPPPAFDDAVGYAPASLSTFSGTATPPTGFVTLSGANSWAEAGGVATPVSGFSTILYNQAYSANQQAACTISTLPPDGGLGFFINFRVVDSNNRYRAYVSRVTGSTNDTVTLDKVENGVITLIDSTSLGLEMTAGDKLGIDDSVSPMEVNYYAAAWAEWRTVLTSTLAAAPSSSFFGMGSDTGACTEFLGQGTTTTDSTPPSVPGNCSVINLSSTSTRFTCDASTGEPVSYANKRCSTAACTPSSIVSTGPDLVFDDIGLTPSTLYRYCRTASDIVPNESTCSTPVSETTTPASDDITAPSAPTNLMVARVPGSTRIVDDVTITWTASTDAESGIAAYHVERGNSACASFVEIATPGPSQTFTDAEINVPLEEGRCYRVSATNGAGLTSSYSAEVKLHKVSGGRFR